MSQSKYTAELDAIADAHGGKLFPHDVVNAARNPNSVLHGCFEWDDSVAAEEYRLHQARKLIRVQTTMLPHHAKPVHAFVSLTTDRAEDGGYLPIQSILSNENLLIQMKADAARELEIFTRKFHSIDDLQPLIAEAKKFIQRQKEECRPAAG